MRTTGRSWARKDPRAADHLRAETRMVARQAIGVRKRAARRLGKSEDAIDRMCAGTGAPYQFAQIVLASESPGHWERWVRQLIKRNVARMEPPELVARWHEILERLDPESESVEARAKALYARTGDLLALAEASDIEAGLNIERAEIARRMAKLGIDPRTWGERT